MSTTHTPGPWKSMDKKDAQGNPHCYSVWQDIKEDFDFGYNGKKVCQTTDGTSPEHKANAQLIASAPELLENLQNLVTFCDSFTKKDVDKARKAIAKATGKDGER